MTDTIADMLTQIRNAQAVGKETVSIPFSNLKYEIAEILEKEGFIEKVKKRGRKERKKIEIILKYGNEMPAPLGRGSPRFAGEARRGRPAISNLKIVSRPGQRIYKSYKDIGRVKRGYGIVIISTSKGLMTDKEARKQKIGGEVICEIW